MIIRKKTFRSNARESKKICRQKQKKNFALLNKKQDLTVNEKY